MVEKEDPYLFIEEVETVRLPTRPLKIAYFPSATIDGVVGLPVLILMRVL